MRCPPARRWRSPRSAAPACSAARIADRSSRAGAPPQPGLRAGGDCGGRLLFASGGRALAGVKFGYQDIYDQSYDWDRGTQLGWTAGGGVDYALDGSFALRLEYAYDDFGEQSYFEGRDDVALKTHTLRLAVTYGF